MKQEIKIRILRALEQNGNGGLNISETVHEGETTRNTASEYLKKLEDRGLVKSQPRPPHKLYFITEKGEEEIQNVE
ncbi:hypothetical protein AKJ41_03215 [candidate division MSBL1 archaeon SCGC-AAA259O05]|uniref:ArnR1-like winged helix-turn-helix domain-containing protein n=1 Tax=candidate division MSBL1 archaeon SCGC-AAA259O05 TaxID=1698271 RepID=A0A133V3H0_9EURY|nr:hypothetical protein AKJ41_03215 [candidate division MSBL1 archaeon SCGC-AAA259O05]